MMRTITNAISPRFARTSALPLPTLVFGGGAVVAILLYGYFLNIAISYAIDREDAIAAIGSVGASIAELDAAYVALEEKLSLEEARARGFTEVSDPLYISIAPPPRSVGLREE